jgi:hypothetical protein
MRTRQWTRTLGALVITLVITMGCATTAAAQADSSSPCRVTIDTPRSGEKLGPEVLITGTATIPRGRAFLYGFVHRLGVALWWPTGGGAATIDREHGSFSTLATLGVARDVGAEFEMVVQAVDASEHARLEQWFKQAEATGSYPGIPLPPFAQGCGEPPRVNVTKAR